MSKAIKFLLTEWVGECRNILSLTFSEITFLRSANTVKLVKAAGSIFPALTSHSVNKSLVGEMYKKGTGNYTQRKSKEHGSIAHFGLLVRQ